MLNKLWSSWCFTVIKNKKIILSVTYFQFNINKLCYIPYMQNNILLLIKAWDTMMMYTYIIIKKEKASI